VPVVRRTAEDDLVDIWLYVAQRNRDARDPVCEDLDRQRVLLADHPHLGRARPDIAQDLRNFPVGNCLILCRLVPDGIDLVRVVHGACRLDSLMM
jgi:toxin ParE1/3/4